MSWHEQAKCTTINPDHFDVKRRDLLVLTRWPRGQTIDDLDSRCALCDDCPVAPACARAAMEPMAWWTIRAGIPLPYMTAARNSKTRRALAQVAAGCSPKVARTLFLATLKEMRVPPPPPKNRGVAS